ncbi:2-hydroxy-acid oxidase [Thioclava sp. NG1]|uniref:FAD-binding protein n=1 Tax=Thioclava sp. NG1 TaxID=2182426 RepID=UPI000D614EB1|nr:FAD-binding protein [Thioclava sp. NG1]PWE48734.1 2-hydroxy-acid oxidase [Thioclava sp. NG1]
MRVESEAQLAEAVRDAGGALAVRGGGTRPVGRCLGEPLEVGISGITLYEPGALTLVVGAGTPLAEVEAAIAAEGQRLPFEPANWGPVLGVRGQSTVGGVVAANVSGPRRVQAGACRDSLIGTRFVDGRGQIVKNGGRVMKNVTGYDLVKLMAGGWGTLGVMSEVAFKLLPAAPSQATVVIDLPAGAAQVALAAALGSPFDVSGAGWLPGTGAVVRVEGLAESVAYRAEQLRRLMEPFGPVRVEEEGSAAIWQSLRDLEPFIGKDGDLWRLSVKPSEASDIVARLGGEVLLDWGGGLIWALLPEGSDVRALAAPYTGHATCMRGAAGVTFEPEPAPIATLTTALRAQFDPKGILNPGRMG